MLMVLRMIGNRLEQVSIVRGLMLGTVILVPDSSPSEQFDILFSSNYSSTSATAVFLTIAGNLLAGGLVVVIRIGFDFFCKDTLEWCDPFLWCSFSGPISA